MRRLEYERKVRSSPCRARDSTEAVIVLAQISRERKRLEQERHTLMRRVGRIDFRLGEIGATETRIVPIIQVTAQPADSGDKPKQETRMPSHTIVSKRFAEFTVQY